jgi:hypothetical protein
MTTLILWLMKKTGIGKFFSSLIVYAAIIGAIALGFWIWLDRHDTALLKDYVKQVELDTAKAKLAETERQLAAGRAAAEEYAQRLAEAEAKERADDAETEKRIADYEKQLAAKGRSCRLNGDDLKFLRHS